LIFNISVTRPKWIIEIAQIDIFMAKKTILALILVTIVELLQFCSYYWTASLFSAFIRLYFLL